VVLAVRQLQLQVMQASTLITIEGSLFIVTVFVASPLIKLLSMLQLYTLSIVVIISGVGILAASRDYTWLVTSTVVMGLGLGLLNLVVSSWIGRLRGEKGKIVGLFSAAVATGASLGPMTGGFIGSAFGVRAIFVAFLPVFALLLAFAYWFQKQGELNGTEHALDHSAPGRVVEEAVAEELVVTN
jgi:MFS family permease